MNRDEIISTKLSKTSNFPLPDNLKAKRSKGILIFISRVLPLITISKTRCLQGGALWFAVPLLVLPLGNTRYTLNSYWIPALGGRISPDLLGIS